VLCALLLGNHRRQSQQSRLELGLRWNGGVRMAAAAEVDVVAKLVCKKLAPELRPRNINAAISPTASFRARESSSSELLALLQEWPQVWDHHSLNWPAHSWVSITLPASDTEGPRFSFWARPSLFRPPFFKSYARRGASMIAPSLPIASTGQPSIASLQSASSSGVSGCL
jgi:hypothetical protein